MTSFLYVVSYLPPVGHSSNHEYHCWNLQDSRAVVRIFIALLRFSFDCPSYLGHHIRWWVCLSDFNQTGIVWIILLKSPQYQISCKCVMWDPRWYVLTDGRTDVHEAERLFAWLCERAWNELKNVCSKILSPSLMILGITLNRSNAKCEGKAPRHEGI